MKVDAPLQPRLDPQRITEAEARVAAPQQVRAIAAEAHDQVRVSAHAIGLVQQYGVTVQENRPNTNAQPKAVVADAIAHAHSDHPAPQADGKVGAVDPKNEAAILHRHRPETLPPGAFRSGVEKYVSIAHAAHTDVHPLHDPKIHQKKEEDEDESDNPQHPFSQKEEEQQSSSEDHSQQQHHGEEHHTGYVARYYSQPPIPHKISRSL